jgi:hypothetical protein
VEYLPDKKFGLSAWKKPDEAPEWPAQKDES